MLYSERVALVGSPHKNTVFALLSKRGDDAVSFIRYFVLWRDETPCTSSVKSEFRVRSFDPFRKEEK